MKTVTNNPDFVMPSLLERRKNRVKTSTNKVPFQVMIIAVVTICTLFSLFPLLITILNSLKTADQVNQSIFSLPSGQVWSTFCSNFSTAWSVIGKRFFPTVIVAIVGAIGTTMLGAVLSYILVFKNFYFKNVIFMLFISVLLVPSIIGFPTLVPLIRDTFHLGDTYFGYIMPTIGGAQVGAMFLFRTFFSQHPKSLYESARLEGANDVQVFFKLTLPLGLPIMLYYALTIFTSVYNDFLWASLILDNKLTLMSVIFSYADNNYNGALYAIYIISSLPLIFTTFISMKYFASGEFASGMKL